MESSIALRQQEMVNVSKIWKLITSEKSSDLGLQLDYDKVVSISGWGNLIVIMCVSHPQWTKCKIRKRCRRSEVSNQPLDYEIPAFSWDG